MKQKTFFQVSKALFFRDKKQNSETISDIVLILAYLLFYFKNMLQGSGIMGILYRMALVVEHSETRMLNSTPLVKTVSKHNLFPNDDSQIFST